MPLLLDTDLPQQPTVHGARKDAKRPQNNAMAAAKAAAEACGAHHADGGSGSEGGEARQSGGAAFLGRGTLRESIARNVNRRAVVTLNRCRL